MKCNFITKNSHCLTINKQEYASQLSFSSSRIRQDKKIELDMKQEYSGRELYEMIQNADDEGSPKIELNLTKDNHLHIKNWGERPFSEGGLLSILRSFLSTKTEETIMYTSVKPIGNKGLGFRSLLNWSDEITIHSNGVKCCFCEKIAKREWETIKKNGIKNKTLSEEDLLSFETERKGLPLPILSIPEVDTDTITKQNTYNLTGACTTDIEVLCKDLSVVEDIEKKIKSLPCSVLLFLRNIKKIDIINKGHKRTLKIIKSEIKEGNIQSIDISDNGHIITFIINNYQTPDHTYEVGVAYPLSKSDSPKVLYSYFPTQVKLNIPAIYHGTFELDSSRNHLVQSAHNEQVLKKLGEIAVVLSNYLTTRNILNEETKWNAYNLLNFSKSDVESGFLFPLVESIRNNLKNACIFPIVKSTYSEINSSLWLGNKLANWLIKTQNLIKIKEPLSRHIIPPYEEVFSNEKYLSEYVIKIIKKKPDDLYDIIEDISTQSMPIELRVELIDAIVECGGCSHKLNILVDAVGTVLDANSGNTAYILSMSGNSVLPKCLNINSVDDNLVSQLQQKWDLSIRQVTDKLQQLTSVINGDYTAIQRKIELWSANEMDEKGMREVMEWKYNNNNTKQSFTSELYLLNRIGVRKKASCMILNEPSFSSELAKNIEDEWWLIGNLAYWKEALGADSEDETTDFLYKTLGVSRRVPVVQIYYGDKNNYLESVRDNNNKLQIPNNYCNNFASNNKITKSYNYAYVPIEKYLSAFTLTEALGLILSDDRAVKDIMNNNISILYRSEKSETVKYSYSSSILRSFKLFSPLQKMVIDSSVFGCNIDYDYLERKMSIDRVTKINPLLVSLGAQTSITNFSIEELYILLSQEKESMGIQKKYKELREAIKNKKEEKHVITELRHKYISHVWARKNGQLEWCNIDEVYYWDNDQLPRIILSNLPKLEIGNRVGEDSVANIFGVKLAKDIDISFSNFIINENLSKDMQKFISERIKYFLAYRICDDVKNSNLIRQSVNALKQLCNNLQIYSSSSYSVNGELQQMKEGDILMNHICSSNDNFTNAIMNPAFSENLNEAVCMVLKVTSNTMSNYFRNIITHDIHYIEYIIKKDITPEVWTLTLKNIGISEYEQKFWNTYSESYDSKLDIRELAEHITDARDYILSIYPYLLLPNNYTEVKDLRPFEQYNLLKSMGVNNSSLLGGEGLKDFYMDYFNTECKRFSNLYYSQLYQKYAKEIRINKKKSLQLIKEYKKKCEDFSKPFYKDQVEDIKLTITNEEDLNIMIKKLMRENFNFNPEMIIDNIPTNILPSYEKILLDHHLSEGELKPLDVLIAKFEGLENLFEEHLKIYTDKEFLLRNSWDNKSVKKDISINYLNCHSIIRDIHTEINNKKKRKAASGYAPDRLKYYAGKQAELVTYEAMKASAQFVDVYPHSSILNKEGGNDNLHYDISYRKKDSESTDIRFLEVKAMSGNSIIMSCMEYQFAKEHCEQYDFAIVKNGKIFIIERPFSTKDGKLSLEVQPETYMITIEWD